MLPKKVANSVLTLALTILASSAFAVPSKVSYKEGTIEEIDLEKKLITIVAEKSGEVETYRYLDSLEGRVKGKKSRLSALSPGQTVVLKS